MLMQGASTAQPAVVGATSAGNRRKRGSKTPTHLQIQGAPRFKGSPAFLKGEKSADKKFRSS